MLSRRGGASRRMILRWRLTLLCSAALCSIPAARAQEAAPAATPESGASLQLPAIEVEGQAQVETATGPVAGYVARQSRSATKTDTPILETPQSISVVTREQLDDRKPSSVAGALRYTPGAQVEGFGYDPRYDQITIRGFDITTFADFRDGLRQPYAGWLANWRDDPYTLERIDIIKGPASVLYGQSSPGGLVNKISKRPIDVPLREVELQYGSFNRYQGQFDLTGPLDEAGRYLYRLTGLARDAETPLDGSDHDDRELIAPAFTWRPSDDTTLTVLAQAMHMRVEPAPGVFVYPDGRVTHRWVGDGKFNKHDQDQYGIAYEFEHRFSDAWTVRQHARYQDIDLTARYLYSAGLQEEGSSIINRFADILDENLQAATIDNHVQLKADTGPLAHTAILGVDYQRVLDTVKYGSDVGPPLDLDDPDHSQDVRTPEINVTNRQQISDQVGIYVQDQIAFGGWRLTGGLRQDWSRIVTHSRLTDKKENQDDEELTGRVGLLYLTEAGLAPYASYATSFFPSPGRSASGEPFDPTTGRQYEVGVKYQPPGWNFLVTASLFDIKQDNVETDDPGSDNFLDRVQSGQVHSRGFEIEGGASLMRGLDIQAAYTYQDVEISCSNDGDEGNRPGGTPEHIASIWLDYTVPEGPLLGLGGGGGVRYVGSAFGDNLHEGPKQESYTLLDAALHYDWRGVRFALNAENLLDKDYVQIQDGFSYRAPGRNVIASVRLRW